MDEFSTSRPAHLRNDGSGYWTLAAVLVILLLVMAIIGLGSSGGGTGESATTGDTIAPATSPETAPAPVVAE